jgi:hypothetical protein
MTQDLGGNAGARPGRTVWVSTSGGGGLRLRAAVGPTFTTQSSSSEPGRDRSLRPQHVARWPFPLDVDDSESAAAQDAAT